MFLAALKCRKEPHKCSFHYTGCFLTKWCNRGSMQSFLFIQSSNKSPNVQQHMEQITKARRKEHQWLWEWIFSVEVEWMKWNRVKNTGWSVPKHAGLSGLLDKTKPLGLLIILWIYSEIQDIYLCNRQTLKTFLLNHFDSKMHVFTMNCFAIEQLFISPCL